MQLIGISSIPTALGRAFADPRARAVLPRPITAFYPAGSALLEAGLQGGALVEGICAVMRLMGRHGDCMAGLGDQRRVRAAVAAAVILPQWPGCNEECVMGVLECMVLPPSE